MSREIEIKCEDSTPNFLRDDFGDGGVFVSDLTTYIVTDDLHVMPITSGVSIQLLSEFGFTDCSQLQEKTLVIGF